MGYGGRNWGFGYEVCSLISESGLVCEIYGLGSVWFWGEFLTRVFSGLGVRLSVEES